MLLQVVSCQRLVSHHSVLSSKNACELREGARFYFRLKPPLLSIQYAFFNNYIIKYFETITYIQRDDDTVPSRPRERQG